MGFFDTIKKAVGSVSPPPPAPPPPAPKAASEPVRAAPPPRQEPARLDTAGFDLARDEESFFEAVRHMDSGGAQGGTDASRAEISAKFGIRDRGHWQTVRQNAYQVLATKHGSIEAAMQRELNWRGNQTQKQMQAQTASSPALAPVEGVALDTWAAMNAAIVSGANLDDLLKGAAIERARWDRVTAEWNARMSKDTTFAVATAYGNAFQNASKGKYAAYAKEAIAARAENRDPAMAPPITFEQFYELMLEQSYASAQGRDPIQVLKDQGLTAIDWSDLGSFMGYLFTRTALVRWDEVEAAFKNAEARVAAKYPGVKVDVKP